jgi:TPR repeat protein
MVMVVVERIYSGSIFVYILFFGVAYLCPDSSSFLTFEAFTYLKRSADQGHDHAQYLVGLMYQEGQGVAMSLSESFKYFTLSAQQSNAEAEYSLGMMGRRMRETTNENETKTLCVFFFFTE